MQDGAGEVDAGEPEKLQSRRRGEPTHDPGVPAVVVGDLTDVRQRGDVEPAVGAVGAALLGRQLYISMLSPERSLRDEYNTPDNALLCGGVAKLPRPPSDV
ncbi:hypothetical protein B296_00020738 [Ensete ventricosum]|uniref:Uncharacterized protein n=1 Tax=Ensete ventricosum TaxID=4639 RepID=A0A427B0P9_ENSVE|nr:hypothetical protein B296_00020738 [Ensete ventricosum]